MTTQRMYPTRDEVVDAIERLREGTMPDHHLAQIHLQGDSLRTFSCTFVLHNQVVRVSVKILASKANDGTWYAQDCKLFNLFHTTEFVERKLDVYPDYLVNLMELDPYAPIVSCDDESDAYPEGNPIFGYGLLDESKHIKAFVQHDGMDEDDKWMTYNPYLPHGQVVTDAAVLEAVNASEYPNIRYKWIDDEKEWWA